MKRLRTHTALCLKSSFLFPSLSSTAGGRPAWGLAGMCVCTIALQFLRMHFSLFVFFVVPHRSGLRRRCVIPKPSFIPLSPFSFPPLFSCIPLCVWFHFPVYFCSRCDFRLKLTPPSSLSLCLSVPVPVHLTGRTRELFPVAAERGRGSGKVRPNNID